MSDTPFSSLALLPPDAGGSVGDSWRDPLGCFITSDGGGDCPVCPSLDGGCGEQRSYSPPVGAPLSTSISVDDAMDSDIEFITGVTYSDCISFTHSAKSSEGCVDPGRPDNCNDCPQYGQSVELFITRTFAGTIDKLKVILLSPLRIDDIAYFGDLQLNTCCPFLVEFPLDVTDLVTAAGDVASFSMRAADVACGENIISLNLRFIYSLK